MNFKLWNFSSSISMAFAVAGIQFNLIFLLIFAGEILDASRRWAAARCETEENQFSSFADGIWTDTVWDFNGRHQIEVSWIGRRGREVAQYSQLFSFHSQEVQSTKSDGERWYSAEGEERRARCHSWVYQIASATSKSESNLFLSQPQKVFALVLKCFRGFRVIY